MKWDKARLTRVIEAARGDRPVSLCLQQVRLVNVLSGRVQTVDLGVQDGLVVGWGDYRAEQTIEADGMYLCPGFIDGHIHLESSLLSPAEFSAAVLPHGTTAVVADPHEIANVHGLEGIRYMLAATEDLPLDVYYNLPSCVPASPLETSGAVLNAEDLSTLRHHPRVLGLAEVMNFPGVVGASGDVLDKLVLFQDAVLDGHAPLLSDLALNAYLASGIGSDHECTSADEAREKLAKGMTIMIRQGSQSKDLAALVEIVDDYSWPRCMLVSDDRHPDDLLHEGHMNAVVNRAMDLGLDPVRAIALATLTPARYFRLQRRGAVAPGYRADFSLSPTLHPWQPVRVFKDGREVARDGRLGAEYRSAAAVAPPPSPMLLSAPRREQLRVAAGRGRLRVIGIREGSLLTDQVLLAPRVVDGEVVSDPERDILKIAVFNRYQPDRPPALGFVRGLGLKRGAVATTVAHDSHNLVVAGDSDGAMVRLADRVREHGGGMAICSEEGEMTLLPLPIAGLMSDRPIDDVVARLERLKERARDLGSTLDNPFMALSFLALPVIPELKITDLGLVDVTTFSPVPLFVD